LVGNDEGAAVLEASLLAPELVFRAPAVIAITGAEATPKVNGEPRPRNESFAVKADDKLTFDFMKTGARCYIAVAGGIEVPVVLGSRSTYGLGALGGFSGRKVAAGDVLPVGQPRSGARAGRKLASELTPSYPKSLELRVVTGPFGAGSDPSNIVDAGYPYGSIQVPGGLEPIILHRDAVSGGGYAMIGTVISADMDRVAQMQPNNLARFVVVDWATALKARAVYKARDARLRSLLSA
jgi:allophanate hydrolase subunit 2